MRIAITGGIAEGKSTVLTMLRDLGGDTVSSDEVARRIFNLPEVNERLAALAGAASPISAEDFRKALAASPAVRREANRLIHRKVMDVLLESDAMFYEVPLLIEACAQVHFDSVWVVTCGLEIQRTRLLERYHDAAHVDAILATQLPTRVKTCFADLIVRTNQPREAVRRLLSEAMQQIRGE